MILDQIIVIKRSSLDQCLAVLTIRKTYPPVINLGIHTLLPYQSSKYSKNQFWYLCIYACDCHKNHEKRSQNGSKNRRFFSGSFIQTAGSLKGF